MSIWHPDPAEIAALNAELLSESESRELQEHIAECTHCRAIELDLEQLREELSGLEPVGPMPAEFAARIDAALAAEQPLVSRETPPLVEAPAPAPRAPRRRAQYLLAAAGAAIALGVGGLVAQTLASGTEDDPVSAGMADGADSEMSGQETLDSAEERLEVEVRVLLGQAVESAEEFSTEEDGATGGGTGGSTDESQSEGQNGTGPGDQPGLDAVPACISSVIDRSEEPLAATADYEFNGIESYLVLLPHRDAPERVVDAYVIDSACAERGGSPAPDDLLVMESYSR